MMRRVPHGATTRPPLSRPGSGYGRPVKLGPQVDGLRVVREGLQSNDWVIVNGLMSARPGSIVNPTRAAIGAAPTVMAGAKP